MTTGLDVDISDFIKKTNKIKMDAPKLRRIGTPAIYLISNTQKTLVPVLSGATRSSIKQHDIELTDTRFVTDIGPETNYAPVIEYGRADMPNYPIQPFIRPSVFGQENRIFNAIAEAHKLLLEQSL